MPTCSQSCDLVRSQEIWRLSTVRTRMEATTARSSIGWRRKIDILQKLPFVLVNPCIGKAAAVLQSSNIATEQAGAASGNSTDKYIFILTIVSHKSFAFALPRNPANRRLTVPRTHCLRYASTIRTLPKSTVDQTGVNHLKLIAVHSYLDFERFFNLNSLLVGVDFPIGPSIFPILRFRFYP